MILGQARACPFLFPSHTFQVNRIEDLSLPRELRSDPNEKKESKMIKTLLSQRPQFQGVLIGLGLVLVCCLMSLWSWENSSLFQDLVASRESVFQNKELYRLISSLFLHGDLGHLLSNSYMLFVLSWLIFGTLTWTASGTILLLFLFVFSGAGVSGLTLLSYSPQVRLLGISGLVYFMAGFWFINYMMIDRRRSFSSRLVRTVGVCLVILFPSTFEEEVSYGAHFHGFWVGLMVGFAFFTVLKKKIRSFEEFSTAY